MKNYSWLILFLLTLCACVKTPTATPSANQQYNGQIVFYSGRNGNQDIFIMREDGSDVTALTEKSGNNQCPSFSIDGRRIVFNSNRDGNDEIYIMDSDGSNQSRVTNTETNEIQPQLSPEGLRVLFSAYTSPAWDDGEIYVMNLDGTGLTQLTDNSNDDTRPVWSPDGKNILFSSNQSGNYELYSLTLENGRQTQLTQTGLNELFGAWSPDGNLIVYTEVDFSAHRTRLHLMNADGSRDRIIETPGNNNEDAVWSGDGTKLFFQSNRDGNFEVYSMNPDGSDQKRLTSHSSWDGWPGWGLIPES